MSLPDVASDAVGVDVETLIIIKMENAINERARLGGTKHNARLPRAGIVAAKILLGTVMTQNCISILFRSNCPVTCSNSTRLVQLNDCGFHELRYSEKFLQTPQRKFAKIRQHQRNAVSEPVLHMFSANQQARTSTVSTQVQYLISWILLQYSRVAQATRSAFDQVYVRDIQGHSQVPTVVILCRRSASPPSMTSFVCAAHRRVQCSRAEWRYMAQVTLSNSLPLLQCTP